MEDYRILFMGSSASNRVVMQLIIAVLLSTKGFLTVKEKE